MKMTGLHKLHPGDTVAVLSPAGDAASYFPQVLDCGVDRLRQEFGLIVVEYPNTRKRQPTPAERAHDLMAAFADPEIKAIFTTIGGSDQVRILPYVDRSVIRANPKPFFGYSDNTHIAQLLWNEGVPSYYGGAVMVQLAMPGPSILKETEDSLRRALFTGGMHELSPAKTFTDIELDWANEENLKKSRDFEVNDGLYWSGTGAARGLLWGGCVESLLQYFSSGYAPPDQGCGDIVLFLETAENIPEPWVVETLVRSLGEMGVLSRTSAVLVGRPKAWEFSKPLAPAERMAYRASQRDTVATAIRTYRRDIPIVQNLDFGHTDPQVIVPMGQEAIVDANDQKIFFHY